MSHEYLDAASRWSRRSFLRAAGLGLASLAASLPKIASAGRGGGPSPTRPPFAFGSADGAPMWWAVKKSTAKVGPGPNLFSDSESDIWVDTAGLHLTITKKGGQWWCTEVIGQATLGYGTYTFVVDSELGVLAPSVVLGLFTWSDAPDYAHREIDIEFARWGDSGSPFNAQYTVQPYDATGHRQSFTQGAGHPTTHQFTWRPGSVEFKSWAGLDTSAFPLRAWTYSGADAPIPGNENPRMNLWLFRGRAPSSGRVELAIRDFRFAP